MLTADRFIVRSTERDSWLRARAGGVTATTVAEAATPVGFQKVIEAGPVEVNAFMEFGSEAEKHLMSFAHREHGLIPNDWLIRGERATDLATPDGMSIDHTELAESKTTGKDWGTSIPIKYRRQCQWQMHVTGAERCLLLWNLRVPDNYGWFYLGWLEPKTVWIDRDEKTIADLIEVADRVMEVRDERRAREAA